MTKDEQWMRIAIEEAELAITENEIPVGAILVKENKLIAQAHNQSVRKNDPTGHAEIQVLRIAGKNQKNYRLNETTLYVTLEPCAMCLGAIIHARVERLVFGASDPKSGVCGSTINLTSEKIFNHRINITKGVLKQDCKNVLQLFFKSLRRK